MRLKPDRINWKGALPQYVAGQQGLFTISVESTNPNQMARIFILQTVSFARSAGIKDLHNNQNEIEILTQNQPSKEI